MKIKDVEVIKPIGDKVVVEVVGMVTEDENGLVTAVDYNDFKKGTANLLYRGVILETGPNVKSNLIKEGKYITFNMFAGYNLAVGMKTTYKLIEAHNIMTVSDEKQVNYKNTVPTFDRIMIGIVKPKDEDLLMYGGEENNPYEQDIKFGEVLKLGEDNKSLFKTGDIVGIEPHTGEPIQFTSDNKNFSEIRVLFERDVLLKIKN